MESVVSLIDKAAKICGSRYALAKRLDVSESNLSQMVSKRRGLPPGLAARLAEVADEDPLRAAAKALVEAEKDPVVRDKLAKLLLRAGAWAAGAVISMTAAAPSAAEAGTGYQEVTVDSLYIMST